MQEEGGARAQKEFKKETLSGMYASMSSVYVNLGNAVGTLFMGIYFTGGQQSNLLLLALIYPLTAIVYAIGWICNKKITK